jgi:hypothetical protein
MTMPVLLTLANCPPSQIAARLAVEEVVVDWAERLYFDVRRRREASAWISSQVIALLVSRGEIERAVECRAAYWGGAAAAELILDGNPKLATLGSERLGALENRLIVKAQTALEYPLSAANATQFLKLFLDHQLAVQRLDLAREKFRRDCRLDEENERRARQRQAAAAQRDGAEVGAPTAESERRDRWKARRQIAAQRAAASPLAQLRWPAANADVGSPTGAETPTGSERRTLSSPGRSDAIVAGRRTRAYLQRLPSAAAGHGPLFFENSDKIVPRRRRNPARRMAWHR